MGLETARLETSRITRIMKTTLFRTIALSGAVMAITTVQAALQNYEPFNYAGTALNGQNDPRGWGGSCGLSGPWFTISGTPDNTLSDDGVSLSYPVAFESPLTAPPELGWHVKTGGASANTATYRLLAQPIDLSVDGTVRYASALFRKNRPNGEASNDNILLEFFDAPGNRRWGFGIEGGGDKPWLNANGSTGAATPVTVGSTYLLVTKIVSSASGQDTAYLKVYGAGYGTQFPATEPTTWDVTLNETTAAVLDRVKIRVDPGNQAGTPGEVDDIRIGTSWQDVVAVLGSAPADTTPPTVLSVDSAVSNTLNVIFSEPVSQVTAENTSNYTVTNGSITAISLRSCTNVQITLDTLITGNYTVAVSNVQDIAGNTVAGTNLAGICQGWQDSQSISLPLNQGMAFAMHDKIVMIADGVNIATNDDHFQFLYNTVSGNFDLSVRVESLFRANNNSRAGLMARLNIFFDSPNVLIEATPDRFIFQYRTNAAETTLAVAAPRPPTAFPNCWIRLVRNGAVFTGFSGTNNGVWDLIGSFDTSVGTAAYPSDILVGLVASAGNASLTTRAQFSGFGTSVVAPAVTIAPSGGNLEISWLGAQPAIGFVLQATPTLNSVTWTNVPNSATTNRVFVPTSSSTLFFRARYPASP
jgi:hypothetical protein